MRCTERDGQRRGELGSRTGAGVQRRGTKKEHWGRGVAETDGCSFGKGADGAMQGEGYMQ